MKQKNNAEHDNDMQSVLSIKSNKTHPSDVTFLTPRTEKGNPVLPNHIPTESTYTQ